MNLTEGTSFCPFLRCGFILVKNWLESMNGKTLKFWYLAFGFDSIDNDLLDT
jgi:hypothetical protein